MKWKQWLYSIGTAFIAGGANTVVTAVGWAGAKGAGFDIPTMNLKAAGIMFLSSGCFHVLTVLVKSPLPPPNGDTSFFVKALNGPQQPQPPKV